MKFSALIQLPNPLVHSPYAQPVKMPTDCGENIYNKSVIAIGTGVTSFDQHSRSKLLRHCNLTISSSNKHEKYSQYHCNAARGSVILATPSNDPQCIYQGDSGIVQSRILRKERYD